MINEVFFYYAGIITYSALIYTTIFITVVIMGVINLSDLSGW